MTLEEFMTDRIAKHIAKQLAETPPTDDEMINGPGVGLPLGILNRADK